MMEEGHNDFLPNSVGGDAMLAQLGGEIGDEDTTKPTASTALAGAVGDSTLPATQNDITGAGSWARKVGSGLQHGAAQMNKSLVTGQLPEISLAQVVPKIELHKMRGPYLFFGIGQYREGDDTTKSFNIPDPHYIYTRVKANLAVFSANYMVISMLLAVCFSLTNITFIVGMGLLALMWSYVLRLNAGETSAVANSQDGLETGLPVTQTVAIEDENATGVSTPEGKNRALRMVGAYAVTGLVLYYFASSLLWYILLYSLVVCGAHAIFRNNVAFTNAQNGEQRTCVDATDSELVVANEWGNWAGESKPGVAQQMQAMALVGGAMSTLNEMMQSTGTANPVHEPASAAPTPPPMALAV